MPVIGFVDARSPDAMGDRLRAFRQGLKEAGFVEDENVKVVYRWAEGKYDQLPALAADLVRRPVNVIASGGGAAPESGHHDHPHRFCHSPRPGRHRWLDPLSCDCCRHRHRPMPSSVAHRPTRAATARKIRWIKGCEEARPHSPIEYRITYCRGTHGDLRGIPAANRNW